MHVDRKKIRTETIKSAVLRMGRIPQFTRLQREKMEFPYFTENVRQAAYILCRYQYCEIYRNKIITVQDLIDETNMTTRDDVEPYHILIAFNMLLPYLYRMLSLNLDDPELTKLPLELVKNELPPKHKKLPITRYYCELDDANKNKNGFFLDINEPMVQIKKKIRTKLSNHPLTIFDFNGGLK
ncbi:MAG: hypothetical protein K2X69_10660 [Silvanigrellaceae bacterium]|nr:hypothetical protein [Silvanigrellaceae bacterium]